MEDRWGMENQVFQAPVPSSLQNLLNDPSSRHNSAFLQAFLIARNKLAKLSLAGWG